MEVLGVDREMDAYRIAVDHDGRRLCGLVPEALMGWGRAPHHVAYEWIARRERALRSALIDLDAGRTPPAPYDTMTLSGDA